MRSRGSAQRAHAIARAPAWGAEVVSSNIVGYNKVTLSAGLNLLASQFVLVGGEQPTINDAVVVMSGQSGYDDESFDPTTELRVWTGGGYDTFGWTGNLLTDSPNMASEMGVNDDSLNNKWLTDSYEEAEEPLNTSLGYWLKAGSAGTVTFSGEVPSSDTVTVQVSAGLNLVSYPWPMDVDLKNIQMNGQSGYDDESFDPTTELRVWTGGGYDTYGWTGNLLVDSPNMASEMGVSDNSLDNLWLNDAYEVPDEPLPIGKGFWIKAEKAGSVTFKK